jgi:hypothetical protein
MFASGDFGLVTISRWLEERRVPTRTGRAHWNMDQVKFMLKNETYAGSEHGWRYMREEKDKDKDKDKECTQGNVSMG